MIGISGDPHLVRLDGRLQAWTSLSDNLWEQRRAGCVVRGRYETVNGRGRYTLLARFWPDDRYWWQLGDGFDSKLQLFTEAPSYVNAAIASLPSRRVCALQSGAPPSSCQRRSGQHSGPPCCLFRQCGEAADQVPAESARDAGGEA